MKSLQTILFAALCVLALVGFNTLTAHGARLPEPSAQLENDVIVQLNAFFPECADMEWKVRTYMKRQRHWVLRVAPRDRACIGYKQFLVHVQGFGNDMTALEVRERIELPFSGRTTNAWFPFADVRPPWECY